MNERIPGGCSTYSKRLMAGIPGYPQSIEDAHGSCVHDGHGSYWVDWWSTLGSTILGHGFPSVVHAIRDQLERGIVFSLPHRLEGETAELLCDMAGTEQLRWCKNGSDATEAAVRLARKVTGRAVILTTGYHGFHSDLVTATAGKAGGLLEQNQETIIPVGSPQDILDCLTTRGGDISCLLAEPIFADGTIWPWAEIKEACHKAGALLIFDEVITGFRYRRGPALGDQHTRLCVDGTLGLESPQFAVPDLYCFGKAIANGMPLACVTGPRALMQEYEHGVFFSSTAAAECLSLAACKATLETMRDQPVHEHIWKIGSQLRDRLTVIFHDLYGEAACTGLPPRTQCFFTIEADRDGFLSGMAQRGHLLGRDNFITFSHTEEQARDFAEKAEEVLREL